MWIMAFSTELLFLRNTYILIIEKIEEIPVVAEQVTPEVAEVAPTLDIIEDILNKIYE